MNRIQDDVIAFAQKIVQTKSMTCEEENVAKLVEAKMKELGYDEVTMDEGGSVLGRMGNGKKTLFFDSHMDTVGVIDADEWRHDPYSGCIEDGNIYGRGSVDMKCPLVASIYGAYIAKQIGLAEDTTIYVSCSTMEEDYDGEAVRQLLAKSGLRPDGVVICEPTNLRVALGHRGRALLEIKTIGKGCHASNPQNGINPVYMMEEIISRVEKHADELAAIDAPEHGSLALTNVYCSTASNNSVPNDATIILDRRLALGEEEDVVSAEIDKMLEGVNCKWSYCDIPGTTWTGLDFKFHSFLPACDIAKDAPLVVNAVDSFKDVMGKDATLFRMSASTNAVATSGIFKLPSIVFGPGDLAMAHARDEVCSIDEMLSAAKIYAAMCLNV